MEENKSLLINQLESCKRVSAKGVEFWMGRDLQPILGYTSWENFANVIEKAKMACESAGADAADQFHDTTKGITAGKGAEVQRVDVFLSRYACYLVAMNGDSRKAEIGLAQTYFAVQTRRRGAADQDPESRRLEMRNRVKEANRSRNSAAKNAGVQNYGLFHDAGYRGLYGLSKQEIIARKGISPKDDLLDCAGRVELAANEFRVAGPGRISCAAETEKAGEEICHSHPQEVEGRGSGAPSAPGKVLPEKPGRTLIRRPLPRKKQPQNSRGEADRPPSEN